MNSFRSAAPQVWFAAGAAAITALVLSLAVVVPATIAPKTRHASTLVRAQPTATEVAIVPHRIEVIGTRVPAAVASDEVMPVRLPKS